MKILFLAPQPFYTPRGSPIAEENLLRVLAERGHEIDVLTYHEGSDVEIPGMEIHRIRRIPGTSGIRPGFSLKKLVCDAALLLLALRRVRRHRYDVVHAVEEAVFIALLLRRLFGIPYIYDMDSRLSEQMVARFPALGPLRRAMEWTEALAARRSAAVLGVCESLCEWARAAAPGVPVGRLEDMSQLPETELRSRGPRDGTLRALYVGNLEPYQGIDLLLEGFRIASGQVPALRLDIVGGANGDLDRYRTLARRLGIEGRARFLGPRPVSELGGWLRDADILVSPRIEGTNTPMKIFSYMDSGVAILATRLRTHTQVLDDEVALLVPPEPGGVAAGLATLAGDAELRDRLGRLARDRLRREFGVEAFRRKALDFYAEVEDVLATAEISSRSGR